ncbi:MAG TPA: (d)CMP kinase [Fibrobacteres bacterium]|nr:(d)CMP kinase [Fibrobacterota bacterium]
MSERITFSSVLQVITIDGVSGSGKSSTAKLLAKQLGFCHLDTGAMYRTHTLMAIRSGLKPDQYDELGRLAEKLDFSFSDAKELMVNGKPLPSEIRSPEISSHVSEYCKPHEVRKVMALQQRKLGLSKPCVAEGRDMATVVFPDARWKFYMTARPEVRAQRRVKELELAGHSVKYEEILRNLGERDDKDSNREHAPLKKAENAVEIDTSDLTMDQQVSTIANLVRSAP